MAGPYKGHACAQGQDKAAAGGDQILSSQKGDEADGAADVAAGIPVKAIANGVAHDDKVQPAGGSRRGSLMPAGPSGY